MVKKWYQPFSAQGAKSEEKKRLNNSKNRNGQYENVAFYLIICFLKETRPL
ncbi:hypothetical protein KJ969_03480 [Patescibacteria group bacterium]|nr:hypothetical protein [Patescibacteria group bacterium]